MHDHIYFIKIWCEHDVKYHQKFCFLNKSYYFNKIYVVLVLSIIYLYGVWYFYCMVSVYRADQLKRFGCFSYLNHLFILSLNVKVYIRFTVFLQIPLCFFYLSRVNVGWETCALASNLHDFCFQLEGEVKSLSTWGWRGG